LQVKLDYNMKRENTMALRGLAAVVVAMRCVYLSVSERMVRLQHENQLLKTQSSSTENSQLLQSMLDDANTHKHELECQVRYCVSRQLLL